MSHCKFCGGIYWHFIELTSHVSYVHEYIGGLCSNELNSITDNCNSVL